MLTASDFCSSFEKWLVNLTGAHFFILALHWEKSALLSFSNFKHLIPSVCPIWMEEQLSQRGIIDLRGSHWWDQCLKQLCRAQSPGRHQVEHEPTMRSFGKEGILDCVRRSVVSRSREVILALTWALVRYIWSALSSSRLLLKKRHGHTGESPAKGHWHH